METTIDDIKFAGQVLTKKCHTNAVLSGWWNSLTDGKSLKGDPQIFREKLLLVHSEISEVCEADRKNLMDEKLPHRKGVEVELADALIRIYDLAGAYDLDVAGALVEKLQYNASRLDHTKIHRQGVSGKSY